MNNVTTNKKIKAGKALTIILILALLCGILSGLTACSNTGKLDSIDGMVSASRILIDKAASVEGNATIVNVNTSSGEVSVEYNSNIIRLTDYASGALSSDECIGIFEGAQTAQSIVTKIPFAKYSKTSANVDFPNTPSYGKGWNISAFNLTTGTYTFYPVYSNGQPHDISEMTSFIVYEHRVYVDLPPAPTKEGYTFSGWYYDTACTQPYAGAPILEGTALYAGWRINTYTITFINNNGEPNTTQYKDYKQKAENITPAPKGNYVFAGWFTDEICTQAYDFNADIKGDITLYAKWEIKKYNVTFYVDGEVYQVIEVEHGTALKDNKTVMALLNNLTGIYEDSAKVFNYNLYAEITEDITLYSAFTAKMQKWVEFGNFVLNWGWIALAAGAMLLIAVCCLITYAATKRR